ncbi:MAG: hypothetical protein A2V81_01420 [Candidatus Abawacabacteria bacterium RBG_16_42_10]|uniref:Sortase n=1 Tax=Candidatus Abawacabacteria bacterium RBG_16_42_10 TaxID=1817814 RepID=A0A1F4XLQ8_9BACT|nr:MAG: hypothetical protein A2V81_01420 [Candidatus Abawacabacteria bacterium RBG_16_42_10]
MSFLLSSFITAYSLLSGNVPSAPMPIGRMVKHAIAMKNVVWNETCEKILAYHEERFMGLVNESKMIAIAPLFEEKPVVETPKPIVVLPSPKAVAPKTIPRPRPASPAPTPVPVRPAPAPIPAPPPVQTIPLQQPPQQTTTIPLQPNGGPILTAINSENIGTYSITIPRLGLTNVPVNPTDARSDSIWKATLINGVGQLLYPPSSGHKTVIFGHSSNYRTVRSNYNEIFKSLNKLEVGDNVYIDFQGKRLTYIVKKEEIVPGDTPSIVTDYGREELVLFTCWPYLTSKNRYIIYLDRIF